MNGKKSGVYHCSFKTQPKSLRRPICNHLSWKSFAVYHAVLVFLKQKIWWETRITFTFASDGKNLFAASILSTNILVSIAIWRESDTFPCHNSNHQNSKNRSFWYDTEWRELLRFHITTYLKKRVLPVQRTNFCSKYLQLLASCRGSSNTKRTKYNMRKKKLTFIQLPFAFPKLNQPCVCKKEIPCFGERI